MLSNPPGSSSTCTRPPPNFFRGEPIRVPRGGAGHGWRWEGLLLLPTGYACTTRRCCTDGDCSTQERRAIFYCEPYRSVFIIEILCAKRGGGCGALWRLATQLWKLHSWQHIARARKANMYTYAWNGILGGHLAATHYTNDQWFPTCSRWRKGIRHSECSNRSKYIAHDYQFTNRVR
jgi:hypothetical protein